MGDEARHLSHSENQPTFPEWAQKKKVQAGLQTAIETGPFNFET